MVTTNCQDIKEETRNPLGDPWDWRGCQGLPPAPQDPWELVLHDAKDHIRTGAGRVFRHLTCSSGLAFGKKGTMPLASKNAQHLEVSYHTGTPENGFRAEFCLISKKSSTSETPPSLSLCLPHPLPPQKGAAHTGPTPVKAALNTVCWGPPARAHGAPSSFRSGVGKLPPVGQIQHAFV